MQHKPTTYNFTQNCNRFTMLWNTHCLHCFHTVGWASGRASGLWKIE